LQLEQTLIVGHPKEDEKCWSEAIDRVKELPLTHIHAFTYSKRDNTISQLLRIISKEENVAKKRKANKRKLNCQINKGNKTN